MIESLISAEEARKASQSRIEKQRQADLAGLKRWAETQGRAVIAAIDYCIRNLPPKTTPRINGIRQQDADFAAQILESKGYKAKTGPNMLMISFDEENESVTDYDMEGLIRGMPPMLKKGGDNDSTKGEVADEGDEDMADEEIEDDEDDEPIEDEEEDAGRLLANVSKDQIVEIVKLLGEKPANKTKAELIAVCRKYAFEAVNEFLQATSGSTF